LSINVGGSNLAEQHGIVRRVGMLFERSVDAGGAGEGFQLMKL